METIIENIPEIGIVRRLVWLFKNMLSSGCVNVKRWIEFIMNSKQKLPGLKTFANGISRDLKAVKNGIRMPWSNRAVEGLVNRLKSIKRQM
jgi:transposase